MERPYRGLAAAGCLPWLRDGEALPGLCRAGCLPWLRDEEAFPGPCRGGAVRAARGRSARLAAPGAPPGLRPGWREPTRSTAEPTAARAEPRAAAAGPRVQALCRLRVGAEASRRGDRRIARIARRPPERTERAPRGDRAERGSRVGFGSRSGRLRRSAPHGAGGYRGAASRGAEGPRQGPEDERIRQPFTKGARLHPIFLHPRTKESGNHPQGRCLRSAFLHPRAKESGNHPPRARAALPRACPIFPFTRARPLCYPSRRSPARRGSGRHAPDQTRKSP